jgi:uncharacterized protein YcbK (DUF882 family)
MLMHKGVLLGASLLIFSGGAAQANSISFQPQVKSLSCLTSQARTMVHRLAEKIGPIEITSTCRGRHARRSQHYRGNAVDFRPKAVSARVAVAALRGLPEVGGVGSYGNGIVHADVGDLVHSWHGKGSSKRRFAGRTRLAQR